LFYFLRESDMAKTTKKAATAKAEDQPEASMGGAAGGGKGGRKLGHKKAEAEVDGTILKSVWHNGRGWNPGDEVAFSKDLPSDDSMQSLVNQHVVEGFGFEPNEEEEEEVVDHGRAEDEDL
jgi:hypothetical protein